MAIWDELPMEEEEGKTFGGLTQGRTKATKCPGCGDALRFDANLNKLACNSCGSVYKPETLALEGSFSVGDTKKASEEDADKVEYVCNNCGATIVSKVETAATFCAHCGSPTLLKRRLEFEFAPDLVLPFSITKEDAVKRFNEWIKDQKMKPADFCRNFKAEDNIMGVYVPFWLVDANVAGEFSASGKIISNGGYTAVGISRECKFGLRRVPFDGAKKIDNFLMRALEPFDYSRLQYYNDNYLPGFYAERYNETPLQMSDIIASRLDNYGKEAGKYLLGNEFDDVENIRMNGYSSDYKCSYALLPIWFINYKYHGVTYQFGVNGESGEVGGEVPISDGYRKKQIAKTLASDILIMLVALVIIIFGIYTFFVFSRHGSSDSFRISAVIMGVGILLGVAQVSVTAYKIKWMSFDITSTLDAAPPVAHYIDTSVKSQMVKHDTLAGFVTCSSDELQAIRENAAIKKYTGAKRVSTLKVLGHLLTQVNSAVKESNHRDFY